MCRSCVCLLCSVWGFFPPSATILIQQTCKRKTALFTMLDFYVWQFCWEEEEEKEEEGKKFLLPVTPIFPYWFWSLVDVTPRQKCHLDESLLAQAGTAQHWWQKEEFHMDQINTDVK